MSGIEIMAVSGARTQDPGPTTYKNVLAQSAFTGEITGRRVSTVKNV